MTGYINWMAFTQPIKGDVVTIEGNAVSDAVTVTTGNTSAAAPQGAQYASVWCTVASTIEANIISTKNNPAGETIYNAKEYKVPANIPVQIPNIVPGVTTITVTDI